MPNFEYTARTATGEEQTGTIDLPSRDDVIQHLRKNRLVLVRLREAKKRRRGGKVPTRDIVIFTRQFATMINSGLPLVQALDILAKQTENKILSGVTREVVYDVESGHTLADALSKHPNAFTELYKNMGSAGRSPSSTAPSAGTPRRAASWRWTSSCSTCPSWATCSASRPCRGSPGRWAR